jgi:mannose-6-phosphate isomerase
MQLYPLTFETIFKEKLWGGQKIKRVLGKDYGNLKNCGETWELSGVSGNVSTVNNGPLSGQKLDQLIKEYGPELLGHRIARQYGTEFPLLIKFIDADQDLSIQVHPDDTLAEKRHQSKGKTEMWYVLQADSGASLISGFNQPLDRNKYLEYFESGRLMELLNREVVHKDDVFFLPAGRVHTIGKGLLIAEIQQTSDITYRIYDFDRVDDQGNKRELHVEQALDAIDFKQYPDYKASYQDQKDQPVNLVSCPYFTTNKIWISEPLIRDFTNFDGFKIYIGLEGKTDLIWEKGTSNIQKGDVVLVPASIEKYRLETSGTGMLLESYIT